MKAKLVIEEAIDFIDEALDYQVKQKITITEMYLISKLQWQMAGYVEFDPSENCHSRNWFTLVTAVTKSFLFGGHHIELVDFRFGISESETIEYMDKIRTQCKTNRDHKKSGRSTA